jgi:transposase
MKKTVTRYDEAFKRSIVSLCQDGKTQTQVSQEYGVSTSAISKWIRQYAEVRTEDGSVLSAAQFKEMQRRIAILEEENSILKKAISIFTPH